MELEDWVQDYNELEPFMKECVEYISIYKLYINVSNELVSIEKEKYPLHIKETKKNSNIYSSYLPKEHLIHSIETNKKYNSIHYNFNSLLKLNFTIDHNEIQEFIKEKETKHINPLMKYFTFENCIEDILFDDVIHTLKHLNSIYILYVEPLSKKYISKKQSDTTTKKIKITKHNSTKRK